VYEYFISLDISLKFKGIFRYLSRKLILKIPKARDEIGGKLNTYTLNKSKISFLNLSIT